MSWRRASAYILMFFGLSLLCGVALSALNGGTALWVTMRSFRLKYLLPIILMAPLNYALRYLKWQLLLKHVGVKVRRRAATLTFLAGLGLGLLPGKMGELANPYLLKELDGTESTLTLSTVVMLRYTDILSVTALALLASRAFTWATIPLGILLLIFILVGFVFASTLAFKICCAVLPHRLQQTALKFLPAQQGFRRLLTPNIFFTALALGCLSWAFEGLIVSLALAALETQLPPLVSLFVVAFSTVSAGLSLLPGGIGIAEASIAALLQQRGIEPAIGAVVTVITRISTVWLGGFVGALALFLIARDLQKSEREK